MKKTILLLDIDNYAPAIKKVTLPLIHLYAKRIGSYVHTITERKFPSFPVTYEKLQIYEIAQQMGEGWFLYVDLDTLIHPECPDYTIYLPKGTVCFKSADYSPTRFKISDYAMRDGRYLAPGNWLMMASDLCLDLWRPLEVTAQEAVACISPTVAEREHGVTAEHLVDDYALTQNIARFGLSVKTIEQINTEQQFGWYLWHEYLLSEQEKLERFEKVIHEDWKISGVIDSL